jgi:hypothetical protein
LIENYTLAVPGEGVVFPPSRRVSRLGKPWTRVSKKTFDNLYTTISTGKGGPPVRFYFILAGDGEDEVRRRG